MTNLIKGALLVNHGHRSTSGITRRSFIKRSVVAAVAVANLTVLTGMVDASEAGLYPIRPGCRFIVKEVKDKNTGEFLGYTCEFEWDGIEPHCRASCWYRNEDGTWRKKELWCDNPNGFPGVSACHSISDPTIA